MKKRQAYVCTTATMNAVWHKLLPEVVHDFCGFSVPDHSALTKEIADLANSARLGDNEEVLVDDVFKLLNSHNKEKQWRSYWNLKNIDKKMIKMNPSLSLQDLELIIKHTNELCELISNLDPNAERHFNI